MRTKNFHGRHIHTLVFVLLGHVFVSFKVGQIKDVSPVEIISLTAQSLILPRDSLLSSIFG